MNHSKEEQLLESFKKITGSVFRAIVDQNQEYTPESLFAEIMNKYNLIWCEMDEDDYALMHYDIRNVKNGEEYYFDISTDEDLEVLFDSLPFLEIIDIGDCSDFVEFVVELRKPEFKAYLRKYRIEEALR